MACRQPCRSVDLGGGFSPGIASIASAPFLLMASPQMKAMRAEKKRKYALTAWKSYRTLREQTQRAVVSSRKISLEFKDLVADIEGYFYYRVIQSTI